MKKDLAHVWICWVNGKDDFLLGGLPATCLGSFLEGSASPFWGPRGADVCGEPQNPPSLLGLREWMPLRESEAAALCLLPAAASEAELTVLTDNSGQGATSD